MITTVLAAVLALVSGGDERPNTALAPIGPWRVSTDENGNCALSRSYGEADQPVATMFQATPGQRMMQAFVLARDNGGGARAGKAMLTLSPGQAIAADYTSSKVPDSDQRLTTFATDVAVFDGLATAETVTFMSDTGLTIAIRNGQGAITAFDACQAKRLASWGLDPNLFARGKPMPTPVSSPATWFTADAYPAAARYNNLSGRVVALLTVGEDGLVKGCRAVVSAGKVLDTATCDLAIRNGRFTPAHDATGKAVTSWSIVPVNWSLSG